MNAIQQNKTGKLKSWFRKIGVIGFIFFLLKGIAWLVLAYLIVE